MTNSSTILDLRADNCLVPHVATIDGFVSETTDARGINLRDVAPLTMVIVQTRNSRYRVLVSHDNSVIVQGGAFFPDPTAGRIEGASFGGSLLKVGWIGIGMRMEIAAGEQRIVTSPVHDVTIVRRASDRLH